jgi:hypothetical protein
LQVSKPLLWLFLYSLAFSMTTSWHAMTEYCNLKALAPQTNHFIACLAFCCGMKGLPAKQGFCICSILNSCYTGWNSISPQASISWEFSTMWYNPNPVHYWNADPNGLTPHNIWTIPLILLKLCPWHDKGSLLEFC